MVRHADDFVVLARYQGSRLRGWIESKLEGWLGLEINREKTRVVDLKEAGASLEFPGFTFRYDHDLQGRERRYWHVGRSAKALKKERSKLPEMTDHRQCFQPIPQRIEKLNRHLKGWRNDFQLGVSQAGLPGGQHVRSRTSRAAPETVQPTALPTLPEGASYYKQLEHLGGVPVGLAAVQLPVHA
ncbi:MAG: maturase [Bryobacteraceae bacterium]